jgi:hypothetical protein
MLLGHQVSYFGLNRFVSQLGMEHLFFLVHELLNVLGPLVPWELDSTARDMNSRVDVGPILTVIIIHNFFRFSGRYVAVTYPAERCARSCSVFVPNFLVLLGSLRFLFLCLLCFAGDKHLLIIWWLERRFAVFEELFFVVASVA